MKIIQIIVKEKNIMMNSTNNQTITFYGLSDNGDLYEMVKEKKANMTVDELSKAPKKWKLVLTSEDVLDNKQS